MDYRQARAFLEETGKYGSVFGLDGIRALMERLGNAQDQVPVLHVAGTNGKGSVCAMLAGILQAAGYRTGLYSSPAVFVPEEIIQVDGIAISREEFASLAGDVQAACADMVKEGLAHPTAFEAETAIAFCYFKKKACDFAVLETGLGGELDATNLVAKPVCSLLTSISRDHMAVLGETLPEIAAAKAGIIKPGCPCVTSAQEPEVMEVLRKAAAAKGSALRIADSTLVRKFGYDGQGSRFEISLDGAGKQSGKIRLAGACQKENLACVLLAVCLLQERGIRIPQQAVTEGLSRVHLPGRFERICDKPDFYIDGAHNEGAALFLRQTVQKCFTNRRIVYIIGVLADKEYGKLLQLMLPYASSVFTVTPHNPRALDGRRLAEEAQRFHRKASYMPEIPQAVLAAMKAAGPEGVVLAFGSFSYLGELRRAVEAGTALRK